MEKKFDIKGQKFFNLTAVKKVGKDKKGSTMWEFLCDCGETVMSTAASVKRGNRKSCGCARKAALIKRNKERSPNLEGMTFNRLTVEKRVGVDKIGNVLWECSCQCGGKRIAKGSSLVRNITKSCGCIKKEIAKEMIIDITNQTFHRLTALKMVGFDDSRNAMWEFKCSCGEKLVTVGKYVRDGHKKSCGCIQKEAEEEKINRMIGRQFSRLTVVELAGKDSHGHKYRCKCICGGETVTWGIHLESGHSTSCGCYNRELISEQATKHGMTDTPEYQCWNNMKNRCYNKNSKDYHNYGDRGITICEEWSDFDNFYKDMGNRPSPDLTIERLDNSKPYSKENCVWGTRKDQANNRRDNHLVEYNGEIKTLTQWSRELNMSISPLRSRVKKNWPIEKAFTTPVKQYRRKPNGQG